MRGVYLGFTLDLDIGKKQLVAFIALLNKHLTILIKVISIIIQSVTSEIGVPQD